MRGKPDEVIAMTDKERRFAEESHGLIYAFLGDNALGENEYYDIVAFGYLKAVQQYQRKADLKRYKFSTIAWKKMKACVLNKWQYDRAEMRAAPTYSLDAEDMGLGFLERIPDGRDSFHEVEEQETLAELLEQFRLALDDMQYRHLLLKLCGYKQKEIMHTLRMPVMEYRASQKTLETAAMDIFAKEVMPS